MGYASDLETSEVSAICTTTGYPVDSRGHLLRTINPITDSLVPNWRIPGTNLFNMTSPYGHLHYAVGDSDSFWCFDYALVNAGPNGKFMLLHAVINCERASFISGQAYELRPANSHEECIAAIRSAFDITTTAEQWCCENDIKHDKKGWNQPTYYWAVCVAATLYRWRFMKANGSDVIDLKSKRALGIATKLLDEVV